MSVDSYLELYTLLYSWQFFGIIWDVLASTGIILLPFIGYILNNLKDALENSDWSEAPYTALRVTEIDTIIAIIIIVLAGIPYISFQSSAVTYQPPRVLNQNANPRQINAAENNHSTFATISFIGRPNSVSVPPWWFLIYQASGGLNRAIVEGVAKPLDYRNYMHAIDNMDIEDPKLVRDVNDFYRECFIPARSKYLEEQPQSNAITALLNRHGKDDIHYIGSNLYLNTQGYYNTIRPKMLVPPFQYDRRRDLEWDRNAGDTPPQFGRPFCSQWWSGIIGISGLKSRLVSHLSTYDQLMAVYDTGFANASIRQDTMIKRLLMNDKDTSIFVPRGYDFAYNNTASMGTSELSKHLERGVKLGASSVGNVILGAGFGVFLDMYLRVAPMIQAVVLMLVTLLIPFLLIGSGYKLSVLMTGALLIFSIKFWTVLWFFAYWVDQSLILALFPDPGALTLSQVTHTNSRILLNFVTGMIYIIAPLIFSAILAAGGYSLGRQLDNAKGQFTSKVNSGSSSVTKQRRIPGKKK